MGEVDGIGEAVTGGLAARALEPEAGGGQARDGNCLNCGTPLVGPHCHQCGQRAHVHRTISAWWHDFQHSVLHLDGKLWRTLPLLALRPGELTRRYVEGERARFVSPLALFLFSVFLMFAVFSMAGVRMIGAGEGANADIAAEAARAQEEIERLEKERREAAAAGADTEALDRAIAAQRDERVALQSAMVVTGGEGGLDGDIRTGWPWLDQGIEKGRSNPSLLFYKLQANAYKFSWALIPISVPFLWLLFLHRRRYRRYGAYDHVVFVTYSIAFTSLLLILFVVLRTIGLPSGPMMLALLLIPPIHIYRQLKGAYGLSRFSALWRAAALVFFATIALILFLLLLLAIGVLG